MTVTLTREPNTARGWQWLNEELDTARKNLRFFTARAGGYCLMLAIALPVLLIAGCIAWGKDAIETGDKDRSVTASRVCREAAQDRLRDPSSAKFSGVNTVKLGGTNYRVTGVMSGANALGGTVGHDFRCEASIDGDAHRVISLTVTAR